MRPRMFTGQLLILHDPSQEIMMSPIKTTETIHDQDWIVNKADNSNLDNTVRYKAIFGFVKKHHPKTIFDVGCGSGVLGRITKAWRPEVVLHGCDISTSALERAKHHYDRVWKTDLDREDIPAESYFYDFVMCGEVLEHIYDVHHILTEIKRILKKGGIGLLTVPNLVYWRFRLDLLSGQLPIPAEDDRHIHQFTLNSLTEKLRKARLKILSITGCRIKLPWLAKWRPSVFSDTLIFEIQST